MEGSSPSDSLSGRGGKKVDDRGIELQRFRVQNFVVEPRPSFTNSHLLPQQRAILVPKELLAPRFCPFQSHHTLQVLVEYSLVIIR